MQSFIQSLFFNFQWPALSVLLLLMWQQFNCVKKHLYFLCILSSVTVMFLVGTSTSLLIVIICFGMWVVSNIRLRLYALLICGLVLSVLAKFLPEWMPILLLVIAVVLLIMKSWSWLDQKIEWRSLLRLILIMTMSITLILEQGNMVYFIACLGFILIETFYTERFPASMVEMENRWFEMIELSKEAERQRIYRNIHDVVGADLLQLIYQLDGHKAQSGAKSVMQKVRQSVAVTSKYVINFGDWFEEMCAEAQMRLAFATIEFKQQASITDRNNLPVDVPMALARIMRELMSNIIRHAYASSVTVDATWTSEEKIIVVQDNGVGINGINSSGKGLRSIRQRAQKINADIRWEKINAGGTKVRLKMREECLKKY